MRRATILLLRNRRTSSLKVIMTADVQFPAQNQVKSKKRSTVITSLRPQAVVCAKTLEINKCAGPGATAQFAHCLILLWLGCAACAVSEMDIYRDNSLAIVIGDNFSPIIITA